MADIENARKAKNSKTSEFMAKRNVVGVGIGYKNQLGEQTGDPSVVVMVQQKKPAAALADEDMIPKEVDGTRTDVIEIGYLRAQSVNPQARFRPVMQPGISMAHYLVGAGTLGAVVRDRNTGERLLLSNNHVFANSNNANIGDSILQPGALDSGTIPQDMIARLTAFRPLAYIEDAVAQPIPDPEPNPPPDDTKDTPPPDDTKGTSGFGFIDFLVALANILAKIVGSNQRVQAMSIIENQVGAQAAQVVDTTAQAIQSGATPAEVPFIAQQSLDNLLDAAIATPSDPSALSDEILQIGRVTGTKPAELGLSVAKFGRTTSYTEGRVTLLDATVNVQYETIRGTRTARFVNQVISTGMSKRGDSGSLVVDPTDNNAVGLLFAGSEFATIFTPIDRVLSYFNVEF
jgi:hypothetical protein